MILILKKINSETIQQAEGNISPTFLKTLKPSYLEQKKIKNLILKEQLKLTEKELLKANEKHARKSDFFSSSYSGEWLFLAIAQEKIWVDLEMIKPRSKTLLEKHSQALERHFWTVNWKYFYLLRTAKEAILKASDSDDLDLVEDIQLLSVTEKKQKIWLLPFDWELVFSFQGRKWSVLGFENWEIAYAFCTT